MCIRHRFRGYSPAPLFSLLHPHLFDDCLASFSAVATLSFDFLHWFKLPAGHIWTPSATIAVSEWRCCVEACWLLVRAGGAESFQDHRRLVFSCQPCAWYLIGGSLVSPLIFLPPPSRESGGKVVKTLFPQGCTRARVILLNLTCVLCCSSHLFKQVLLLLHSCVLSFIRSSPLLHLGDLPRVGYSTSTNSRFPTSYRLHNTCKYCRETV